jgi:KAP family P-loop domain
MAKLGKKGSQPLRLLTDQPVAEGADTRFDGLGFDVYAQVLADASRGTPGPFTIGIFGEWGNGKTSLMRLIQRKLTSDDILCVWFNAWQYEKEEHPIVPLVGSIIQEIERNKDFFASLKDGGKTLLRSLRAIAYGFSAKAEVEVPGFAKLEAGFVMKDIIDREAALTPDPIIDRSLYYRAFETLASVSLPSASRIVILIDDLDRCFPDKAIAMLESIKLVLSQRGFIFVLGIARSVLEGYLQHRYQDQYGIKNFDGAAYLDKIVQLAFPLPSHHGRMQALTKQLLQDIPSPQRQALIEVVPEVASYLSANPRSLVRFINNLLIDAEISSLALSKVVPIEVFAVTRCLQLRWRSFYDAVVLDSRAADFAANSDASALKTAVDDKQHDHSFLATVLLSDSQLLRFSKTAAMQTWLRSHSMREAAVMFLMDTLRDTEVGKFSRTSPVVTIIAGDDEGSVRRLTEAMRDQERRYSDEHRTYPVDSPAESESGRGQISSLADQVGASAVHHTRIPGGPRVVVYVGESTKAFELFSELRRRGDEYRTIAASPVTSAVRAAREAKKVLATMYGTPLDTKENRTEE